MITGIYVLIILLLAAFYSFYVATNENIPRFMKDMHHYCFYNCECGPCKKVISGRGNSYIIEETDSETKRKIQNCGFTFWNMTHYFMYLILSYICPGYIVEFFLLGVGFEYFEYIAYDCHDYMDIIANTLGIITGTILKNYNYISI